MRKALLTLDAVTPDQEIEIKIEVYEGKNFDIGRESKDLKLSYSNVSREHARLYYSSGLLSIIDMDSSNGVKVNNEDVTQSTLQNLDVIQIGDCYLKIKKVEILDANSLKPIVGSDQFSKETPKKLSSFSVKDFIISFFKNPLAIEENFKIAHSLTESSRLLFLIPLPLIFSLSFESWSNVENLVYTFFKVLLLAPLWSLLLWYTSPKEKRDKSLWRDYLDFFAKLYLIASISFIVPLLLSLVSSHGRGLALFLSLLLFGLGTWGIHLLFKRAVPGILFSKLVGLLILFIVF